jgi:hypothetical protein
MRTPTPTLSTGTNLALNKPTTVSSQGSYFSPVVTTPRMICFWAKKNTTISGKT